MHRSILLVLSAAILLATGTTIHASLINVTSGATIWSDNFETGAVGSVPALTEPQVGTYQKFTNLQSPCTLLIANAASAGFAANEGSQFLELYRPGSVGFDVEAAGVAANSGSDDLIRLTLAVRVASGIASLFFKDSSLNTIGQLNISALNGSVAFLGSTATTLSHTYTANTWTVLSLEHRNGTTDWSVAFDDGTPETATGLSTANWTNLTFRPGMSGTLFYLDEVPAPASVPEPSSLALIGMGLISLPVYAWRKWK